MSRLIKRYKLTDQVGTPQPVHMPRRAKILSVAFGEGPVLYTEVWTDQDTEAFDGRHERTFLVLQEGHTAPENAGYVGTAVQNLRGNQHEAYLIFEVRGAHSGQ